MRQRGFTYVLVGTQLQVGAVLDQPELVRCDRSPLPRVRRLQCALGDGGRRLHRVAGLGERFHILRRARLQSGLPELLRRRGGAPETEDGLGSVFAVAWPTQHTRHTQTHIQWWPTRQLLVGRRAQRAQAQLRARTTTFSLSFSFYQANDASWETTVDRQGNATAEQRTGHTAE